MTLLFDHINIALIVITCINFLLAVAIFLDDRKQKINRAYSLITLAIISWVAAMIFYRSAPQELAVFSCTVLYVSATFIASTFLYFTYIFPSEKDKHISLKSTIIFFINVALIIMIIWPNFIIQSVSARPGMEKEIVFTQYYWFYFFYIFSFFSYGFIRLSTKYKKSAGIERQQILYVLVGYSITGNLAFITNLIMPWFGFFTLNWIGQLFTIIIVGSTTYAILRHHLFNIKVIATEILIFLLSLVALSEIFISHSLDEVIFRVIIFFVVLAVGLLLIRSVIKEVRLREQVERLAHNLEEANEGQASLMHFMNHQIKGRFGNTKNIFAELLTGDYGVMPEESKPLLEKGLDESTTGINYVQGILKGASAESGKLPYEMKQFDLKPVVEEVASKQKEVAEKKGLEFHFNIHDGSYIINGDAVQLGEAVRNLIDNSINYTPSGSITVILASKGSSVLLSVKDTGVGITPEDRTRMFKSGGRGVNALKINTNATGFGLVFVKGVAEAHKGRVWVESAGAGKGSTFYLELPR